MNIQKFKKPDKMENIFKTSVNITKEQKEFLEKNNLNVSKLVRDYIEKLRLKSLDPK